MIAEMLSQNIHIAPQTVGKLLKEERLEVPPSQRSYRWKVEHAEDLFRDIKKAIEDDAEEYFLGSIVSIKTNGRILIYDGQQRLATTMILIAAIRNELLRFENTKDAAIAESHFLFSERRGGVEADPHLTLNLEDKDFFFKSILPRPGSQPKRTTATRMRDSHKRMEAVARYAKEFLQGLNKNERPAEADKRLNLWLDFIEHSLHVIWVQVSDERTAFTIFETMNDRGLKLSAADLLKNFLHATADDRRQEIVHKWSSMTGVLETVEGEEEDVVEYIRCFWVSRHGHTRTRYLYDRIKEKITNKNKALTLASELESTAQDYAAIVMASHERTTDRGEKVKSDIDSVKVLGVTQLRPMLLSAFSKLRHGQFEELLHRSVAWSVRFMVSGTPSGTIEGYYARIAVDIWEDKITTAEAATVVMNAILPNDDQFSVSFANCVESRAKIARYYLHALQKTEDASAPDMELTLEHILPVKRDAHWSHFSEDEHRAFLHRLGNLALLTYKDNGGSQGTDYAFKKNVLGDPKNGSLTKDAAKHNSWSIAEIEARQNRMAKIAVKTWPLSY